jgi:hypothetical protein
VKSSKTGIYTFLIRKIDSTAYHFVHEYTINSANTWEKKTITILPTAGSTSFITSSGGSIVNDNGQGLQLNFNLAFGSTFNGATNNAWSSNTNHYATSNQVNWMDSTSNNFYLTQVQLEIGEQATPFEHRSFGDELIRCQRYYQIGAFLAGSGNGSNFRTTVSFSTPMRAQPTLSTPSDAFKVTDGYASEYASTDANPAWVTYFEHQGGVVGTSNHGSVSGDARRGTMHANNVSGVVAVDNLEMDSEL